MRASRFHSRLRTFESSVARPVLMVPSCNVIRIELIATATKPRAWQTIENTMIISKDMISSERSKQVGSRGGKMEMPKAIGQNDIHGLSDACLGGRDPWMSKRAGMAGTSGRSQEGRAGRNTGSAACPHDDASFHLAVALVVGQPAVMGAWLNGPTAWDDAAHA